MTMDQAQSLAGVRIAVLATDGVEQVELTGPVDAFRAAGATVAVISPSGKLIQGFNHDKAADLLPVDSALSQAHPDQFDALLLPGGVANPDALRVITEAVAFARGFTEAGKPVAAICHGPWTLIETGFVRGRTMTSWPSLRTDLTNAGASWLDKEVVVDGGLVTSRKPDDIPAFNREAIRVFSGIQQRRAA